MTNMLNIKENPYGLLFFTAIALLFAIILQPFTNMDFKDKTMFSVPMPIMIWVIPSLLIFFWLLYLLTRRCLYSMTITWIHVLMTVFATIFIVIVLFIGIIPSQLTNNRQELIGNAIQILSLIFVFGQLTYLANILSGLFYRQKTQVPNL